MAGRYKAYDKLSSTREVIIEDFPEHWALTRIKFNSLVKARVGWHGLKSDDFTEVGPYLVTGSDFKGKFIQWKNCYHCDEERYEQDPYIQLTNGDLLITKDGTIGKVALVSQLNGKATLNSGVFVVRPLRSDYTTKYYYWLLLSRAFTDFVDYYKTGSTIAHLYQETFVNFKYPLPLYEEQQKIASFLDHETAKIDTLIAKQEKLIELLKEKRQAVISHAVTKGLNPNAPMRDSGVEWLGEVPEHWFVVPIKRMCEVKDGTHDTPKYLDKGENSFPLITSKDFEGKNISFESAKYISKEAHREIVKRSNTEVGDVLMSMIGGNIGKALIVKETAEFSIKNVALFKTTRKSALASYILYYLESGLLDIQISLQSRGGAQGFLSLGDLRNLVFFKVPEDELNTIVEHLDLKISKYDRLINIASDKIALLSERKTALISAAVTGKIDVRDWKPQGV
ncbi:type I restriction enzyme, S subunit [Pseudoalteromonas mariniglutinosa NCIMB 1770]|nr:MULTISPECIES: restriction endonuclease subunit S [Pseudoalteromonas]MCF6143565.1 type I restriction enzyme, S subunit [Pseudoalteromonas mariniglutinosa NCIMB 1770]